MALDDFFKKMLPYASDASEKLGIPKSVILAQWANESNYGRSNVSLNANNYGGIKDTGRYQKYGAYAKYPTLSDFVDDYVRVLNLSYYDDVREIKTNNPVEETLADLSKSPYAESGYGGGSWLASIIKQFDLTKYDNNNSGLSYPDYKVEEDKITVNFDKGIDNMTIAWGLVAVAGLLAIGNIKRVD